MRDYISLQLKFQPCNSDTTDLMAGFLSDVGYESFVADEDTLTAYIDSSSYNETVIKEIVDGFPMECNIDYCIECIEGKDWNEEWEQNYFKPILIQDVCVIHSTFHKDVPTAEYDIVIDPKMAFGTGHHATTCMMIKGILSLNVKGKHVIDMGTGTGILAILSAMRGASTVVGIEIDPGACQNAIDNVRLNHQTVTILEGDSARLKDCEPADVFLANINRNIILADLNRYVESLRPGGVMLLSGFYSKDIPMIEKLAEMYHLHIIDRYESDEDWVAVKLRLDKVS
ncbi:MAG: 50S ribosomal protein L11 methyltransferase [Muribaculaceae bacterium]|nr:50S ribosomal protein L11 methyltransferase [Muribaculaceae bacterium]